MPWTPKTASRPGTRSAILMSTSMPLCDSSTTAAGFSSSREARLRRGNRADEEKAAPVGAACKALARRACELIARRRRSEATGLDHAVDVAAGQPDVAENLVQVAAGEAMKKLDPTRPLTFQIPM